MGASNPIRRADEDHAASFVARFAEAWRDPKPEQFLAFWHPEGRLWHPTMSKPIPSSEIPAHIRAIQEAIPDVTLRVISWAARENQLSIEWRLAGTLNGRRVEVPGVDRFTLRGDRAVEGIAYFDTSRLT